MDHAIRSHLTLKQTNMPLISNPSQTCFCLPPQPQMVLCFLGPCHSSKKKRSLLLLSLESGGLIARVSGHPIEMEMGGLDSNGRQFKNAEEMWKEEVGDHHKKVEWYSKGVSYWEGVEASTDGVLGGYAHVNEPDIKASEAFLNTLLADRFPNAGRNQHLVALDCGSGIGRVTKNLLIRYFNEVDLLEPVSHFLEAARENLAPECLLISKMHKAANFYCVPLQEFTPDAERYDIIWIQWCIGHLADDDFVPFFKRAKGGLKPGGLFILKENIARSGFVLDKEDKSITRSDEYFKELFNQCGLHIYKTKDQKGFPDELFAVKMYALTTDLPKRVNGSRPKRQTNNPGVIN